MQQPFFIIKTMYQNPPLWKVLKSLLGTSSETLSRIFSKMTEEGWFGWREKPSLLLMASDWRSGDDWLTPCLSPPDIPNTRGYHDHPLLRDRSLTFTFAITPLEDKNAGPLSPVQPIAQPQKTAWNSLSGWKDGRLLYWPGITLPLYRQHHAPSLLFARKIRLTTLLDQYGYNIKGKPWKQLRSSTIKEALEKQHSAPI